jgi:xanthine dehydrogenase small subunit
MRREIAFLRQGKPVRLGQAAPTLTLLDYLRLEEHATGTKEGCAEGDCGACTVVLRRIVGGEVAYKVVNSCILLAGQADGSEVITVEDLADGDRLHPVQQAMVDAHGSQCGFCTPGFVMALFGLYHAPRTVSPDRTAIQEWISGNLCRCTGYRPIVEAGLAACTGSRTDHFSASEDAAKAALAALDDGEDLFAGSDARFFAAPAAVASLAALYLAHPDAILVGGATDVGLWITKQLRDLPKVIWLGRVRDLDIVVDSATSIRFGATVTHEAAWPYLASIDSDLGELMRRFAGRQVRTAGTLGGNIANGSPIGDTPPALIALGATLTLQKGDATRALPLEDFFIAYGQQARDKGEFVRAVDVPKLKPNERFRAFKLAKRYDQDISAVMAGVKLTLDGRRIAQARIAFGGMAATPKRAGATEAALTGLSLDDAAALDAAVAKLAEDFSPIDDMRASAKYRLAGAQALLAKALAEIGGLSSTVTRVFGRRAGDATAA